MAMSKKDFIALAQTIKMHRHSVADYNSKQYFSDDQLESLADFCQSQNSNFKRDRWLDYIAGKCGPNGGSR